METDPYAARPSSPSISDTLAGHIDDTLAARMAGDMRIVGLFNIVFGALTCLGIITAVLGVPMLLSGLRLREGADAFDRYRVGGDAGSMQAAMKGQAEFFRFQKFYFFGSLIIAALYFAFIIAMIVFGVGAAMSGGGDGGY